MDPFPLKKVHSLTCCCPSVDPDAGFVLPVEVVISLETLASLFCCECQATLALSPVRRGVFRLVRTHVHGARPLSLSFIFGEDLPVQADIISAINGALWLLVRMSHANRLLIISVILVDSLKM